MGRRWGKSTLGVNLLVDPALRGFPSAWFAPTYKMLHESWRAVTRIVEPVTAKRNAVEHRIDLITGGVLEMWSLDTPDVARGRKYARAIIDEAAMVRALQEAWEQVIRPTLADYRGDAWFMSTPKGFNYYHTLYELGQSPAHPDWMSWQMPTATNPFISAEEVAALEREQPSRVFRQEILAQFEAENEGALWSRQWIDDHRVRPEQVPPLVRLVVAIDPSGSRRGDEVGIVVAGLDERGHAYVLDDLSGKLGPDEWAHRALTAHDDRSGDHIVAEANFGGEMVEATIRAVGKDLGITAPVTLVTASRGKVLRAEPISVRYRQGLVHHVGLFPALENELCTWTPLDSYSPGRLDAAVWALTDLLDGLPAFRADDVQAAIDPDLAMDERLFA